MDCGASRIGFHPAQALFGPAITQPLTSIALSSNPIVHFIAHLMCFDGFAQAPIFRPHSAIAQDGDPRRQKRDKRRQRPAYRQLDAPEDHSAQPLRLATA